MTTCLRNPKAKIIRNEIELLYDLIFAGVLSLDKSDEITPFEVRELHKRAGAYKARELSYLRLAVHADKNKFSSEIKDLKNADY